MSIYKIIECATSQKRYVNLLKNINNYTFIYETLARLVFILVLLFQTALCDDSCELHSTMGTELPS